MESLRTAFRLVVMLAVLGIGYEAWQLYGPPATQVKALALRALEVARTALDGDGKDDGGNSTLSVDPRPLAQALDAPPPVPISTGQAMQAQTLVPSNDMPTMTPMAPPALVPPPIRLPEPAPAVRADIAATGDVGDDSQLKPLFARLEQLGTHDPQLAPWGANGQMYRFSCRASLAGMQNLNRHFDAVAAEPQAAVEAVVAKVEAWRIAQRATAQIDSALR